MNEIPEQSPCFTEGGGGGGKEWYEVHKSGDTPHIPYPIKKGKKKGKKTKSEKTKSIRSK